MQKNNKTKFNIGLFIKFLKGSRLYIFICLIATMFSILFEFLIPQVIRIIVDSAIGNEPLDIGFAARWVDITWFEEFLKNHIFICISVILVLGAISGVFIYIRWRHMAKGAEGFVRRLRDALYAHIQKLPYQWHTKNQTGDIIQRCTADVETVRNFVSNQVLELFRVVVMVTFALIFMFSMNIKMSLVALIFIPLTIAYSWIFYGLIAQKFQAADEADGALSTVVQENLTGMRVVRAFGREQYEATKFDDKNKYAAQLWVKFGHLMGPYWGIGDFITGLQVLTIIAMGAIEAVNGTITLGMFLVFVSYNQSLTWPVRSLGRILSEMSKTGISLERLDHILSAPKELDQPDAVAPPMTGDIVFSIKEFAYKDTKPIIKDVDFTIPQGSTFAILGGTGSGKSTLMHLLNRLYELPPECGRITVGGTDIRKMKQSWVRQNVGMVLQEPYLFSRSLSENISIFRPEATMEEVRCVAGIACVDEAIDGFKNGFDTIIGERGVTLSGGQRQRVAIARMLMQKAPIMVFDDSLSAVDSQTDAKIRAALKEHLGSSTVILISHRITTLMQADTIMVLEDGRVAEMGNHQELLQKEGIYKSIYDIQQNSEDAVFIDGGM